MDGGLRHRGSNELLRSFWGQKRPHVQTFFSSKDPKKDTWFLWYYLVHGDRGVICWPEGWFKNGEVAPYIKPLAETFKEVQGPVSKHVVDAEFAHDPVAIYYSHPSVQATWALDAATHGGTWVNRSSSMENSHGTCSLTRVAWLKTLEDLGIQGRFIHQDHLLDGVLAKDKYKVLLLPRVVCLSDEEAKAIRAFAEAGGTVLADQLCGVFDEHGKSRAKGALDDLFGVKRDLSKGILNGQTLTEVDCEKGYKGLDEKNWTHGELFKGLAVFEPGLAADGGEALDKAGEVPVRVKKGSAVCLNLSPIGYMLTRAKAGNPEWLAFVSGILKDAGVTPRVALKVNGEAPRMVETLFWKNGEKTTFCVIRNIERKASITGFGSSEGDVGDGAVKLTFTFAKAVKGLKNERTGKELGDGAEFSDDWTPWEANVYTFTP
ncbi:MAG: beta-galactosidase trimerization domain-containing protein [Planctomycetota bacterium]|nr:beta-galactosidase trimerization domain-containing protein [Planctomycetota bacterium]